MGTPNSKTLPECNSGNGGSSSASAGAGITRQQSRSSSDDTMSCSFITEIRGSDVLCCSKYSRDNKPWHQHLRKVVEPHKKEYRNVATNESRKQEIVQTFYTSVVVHNQGRFLQQVDSPTNEASSNPTLWLELDQTAAMERIQQALCKKPKRRSHSTTSTSSSSPMIPTEKPSHSLAQSSQDDDDDHAEAMEFESMSTTDPTSAVEQPMLAGNDVSAAAALHRSVNGHEPHHSPDRHAQVTPHFLQHESTRQDALPSFDTSHGKDNGNTNSNGGGGGGSPVAGPMLLSNRVSFDHAHIHRPEPCLQAAIGAAANEKPNDATTTMTTTTSSSGEENQPLPRLTLIDDSSYDNYNIYRTYLKGGVSVKPSMLGLEFLPYSIPSGLQHVLGSSDTPYKSCTRVVLIQPDSDAQQAGLELGDVLCWLDPNGDLGPCPCTRRSSRGLPQEELLLFTDSEFSNYLYQRRRMTHESYVYVFIARLKPEPCYSGQLGNGEHDARARRGHRLQQRGHRSRSSSLDRGAAAAAAAALEPPQVAPKTVQDGEDNNPDLAEIQGDFANAHAAFEDQTPSDHDCGTGDHRMAIDDIPAHTADLDGRRRDSLVPPFEQQDAVIQDDGLAAGVTSTLPSTLTDSEAGIFNQDRSGECHPQPAGAMYPIEQKQHLVDRGGTARCPSGVAVAKPVPIPVVGDSNKHYTIYRIRINATGHTPDALGLWLQSRQVPDELLSLFPRSKTCIEPYRVKKKAEKAGFVKGDIICWFDPGGQEPYPPRRLGNQPGTMLFTLEEFDAYYYHRPDVRGLISIFVARKNRNYKPRSYDPPQQLSRTSTLTNSSRAAERRDQHGSDAEVAQPAVGDTGDQTNVADCTEQASLVATTTDSTMHDNGDPTSTTTRATAKPETLTLFLEYENQGYDVYRAYLTVSKEVRGGCAMLGMQINTSYEFSPGLSMMFPRHTEYASPFLVRDNSVAKKAGFARGDVLCLVDPDGSAALPGGIRLPGGVGSYLLFTEVEFESYLRRSRKGSVIPVCVARPRLPLCQNNDQSTNRKHRLENSRLDSELPEQVTSPLMGELQPSPKRSRILPGAVLESDCAAAQSSLPPEDNVDDSDGIDAEEMPSPAGSPRTTGHESTGHVAAAVADEPIHISMHDSQPTELPPGRHTEVYERGDEDHDDVAKDTHNRFMGAAPPAEAGEVTTLIHNDGVSTVAASSTTLYEATRNDRAAAFSTTNHEGLMTDNETQAFDAADQTFLVLSQHASRQDKVLVELRSDCQHILDSICSLQASHLAIKSDMDQACPQLISSLASFGPDHRHDVSGSHDGPESRIDQDLPELVQIPSITAYKKNRWTAFGTYLEQATEQEAAFRQKKEALAAEKQRLETSLEKARSEFEALQTEYDAWLAHGTSLLSRFQGIKRTLRGA